MKVSDYIVEYLIQQGVTDVFGYPGGMVTHLMDSFSRYADRISAHLTYHEQGAALAACGYAQAGGKIGVAYATGGPGATNLITGICNAYFDSVPVLFLTGGVNTFERKGRMRVRQRGFQETDIVSIVRPVTLYAKELNSAHEIRCELYKAVKIATSGRKGPVLLDIPMDILRAGTDGVKAGEQAGAVKDGEMPEDLHQLGELLGQSERPVLVLGTGIKQSGASEACRMLLEKIAIPVVTSMTAVDLASFANNMYGFIGAYGTRTANFIVAKSDLVISIGSRLDIRQTGADRSLFAPHARIVRVDIDRNELDYKVHSDEIGICASACDAIDYLGSIYIREYSEWLDVCKKIKDRLEVCDGRLPNRMLDRIGRCLPDRAVITVDVGQNQVWTAQSLNFKRNQTALFSGGHGAMGYSLPAAIGAAFASGKTVYCITGDGGLQMNIQELQTIIRENLPVKIILINNYSLGMIRHFQEMYLECNYVHTVLQNGYAVPNFGAVAKAYGFQYYRIDSLDDISDEIFAGSFPAFIEVSLTGPTYAEPKLRYGKPNQDQEPFIDRRLYKYLMEL